MCGVVGIYAYAAHARPVDRDELRAVRDHMAARGPDAAGEWFSDDGRVALGHRRLSIIDLSEGGAQPKRSADGAAILSFNGEIYNYRELRRELQSRGRVFTTDSDTEVLLQLYEEFGTGMLERLRGMFAFALWDSRRRAMLLACDPFGIKPLYYADDGGTLRAASQVKALLRADVDTSPEPAGLAGFYLWGSVPAPWTLYRGIRNLPAGHFMWVGAEGAAPPHAYCCVQDIFAQAEASPARGTRDDALEAIAAALHDSVQAHLVADVPVAAFLSAGLDSSVICSIVAQHGAPMRTLTLAFAEFAGTRDDESPLARSLAAQFGLEHKVLTVHRADFESEREKLLAAMDQPSIDGVNTWFVARAAASQQMKVALSGLGGDELFASYPSFRDVPRIARTTRPLARMPGLGLVLRKLTAPLLSQFTSPKYAGLLEYGGTAGGAYLLRRGLYMPWELPQLMGPDMAREGWARLQTIARLDETAAHRTSRMAVSALETSWYMRHQLLRDADWAGMAHSLEIRVPFVDIALLKSAAPWLAAYPDITKREVAVAAAPSLDMKLLAKPKTGFSVPVREWLGARQPGEGPRGLRGWAREVEVAYRAASHRSGQGTRRAPRVLVASISTGNGGVHAMTEFAVRVLRARGCEPVIAHYEPYSWSPGLSVPSFRLPWGRPGARVGVSHGNVETHTIGCWLPELEFTHYFATRHWRALMEGCDAFMVVSGNVLPATAFHQTGRPYLAWVATDWDGDRQARARHFPWPRRILDRHGNSPVIRSLERTLLRSGSIVSLSAYTSGVLDAIAGRPVSIATVPVPIDTRLFMPRPQHRVAGRLGFAGRFSDPRKDIGLLLHAVALLRARGRDVHAMLMGDTPSASMAQQVHALGLDGAVLFEPNLSREQLPGALQTLDLFVLPSQQEGLCIAALEAMACGVPVVSTRCGGPEEFVLPGETGALVEHSAEAMAAAIEAILASEPTRAAMAARARHVVESRYTEAVATQALVRAMEGWLPSARTEAPAAAIASQTVEGLAPS